MINVGFFFSLLFYRYYPDPNSFYPLKMNPSQQQTTPTPAQPMAPPIVIFMPQMPFGQPPNPNNSFANTSHSDGQPPQPSEMWSSFLSMIIAQMQKSQFPQMTPQQPMQQLPQTAPQQPIEQTPQLHVQSVPSPEPRSTSLFQTPTTTHPTQPLTADVNNTVLETVTNVDSVVSVKHKTTVTNICPYSEEFNAIVRLSLTG